MEGFVKQEIVACSSERLYTPIYDYRLHLLSSLQKAALRNTASKNPRGALPELSKRPHYYTLYWHLKAILDLYPALDYIHSKTSGKHVSQVTNAVPNKHTC